MKQRRGTGNAGGGLAGWVLQRLHASASSEKRLVVLERVTLAPKHALVLVQAEGRKFLVATSPEGTPAFLELGALDEAAESEAVAERPFSNEMATTGVFLSAGNRC